MRFSTLVATDYTFVAATLRGSNGVALSSSKGSSINVIFIRNDSASDRVFRICGGAPFPVPAGESVSYDIGANKRDKTTALVEMDSATFTNITIFGD